MADEAHNSRTWRCDNHAVMVERTGQMSKAMTRWLTITGCSVAVIIPLIVALLVSISNLGGDVRVLSVKVASLGEKIDDHIKTSGDILPPRPQWTPGPGAK